MPTPRRHHRVAEALHRRQLDLWVALDSIHDPHNLSAIIRSCDATAVSRVVWEPEPDTNQEPNPEVAMGTQRWVRLEEVADLPAWLRQKQHEGVRVAATHMGRSAVDFRTLDWTTPWVLVMGNEQRGCRASIAELADANIFLPMLGFVQSLNVSVATAVVLYEIQRQRELAGCYERTAPGQQVETLFREWALEPEGYALDQLRPKPGPIPPEPSFPHADGRGVAKWLKRKGDSDEPS